MYRAGKILPVVNINVTIVEGVSIVIGLKNADGTTGGKTFPWDGDDSYDFWDSIEFNGEIFDVHVEQDEAWSVSIYALSLNEKEKWETDISSYVSIHENEDSGCFTIIEKCSVSGKDVVFESKEGEGIREYDVCCECEEKVHPDYMVTLPEEDDRMEICENCHRKEPGSIEECENNINLTDAVLEKMQEDIANGDLTAIDELLGFVPKENLIAYLPEDQWGDHK